MSLTVTHFLTLVLIHCSYTSLLLLPQAQFMYHSLSTIAVLVLGQLLSRVLKVRVF